MKLHEETKLRKINKNTFLVMKAFSGSATIGERVPS